jgi:hypothetical protein
MNPNNPILKMGFRFDSGKMGIEKTHQLAVVLIYLSPLPLMYRSLVKPSLSGRRTRTRRSSKSSSTWSINYLERIRSKHDPQLFKDINTTDVDATILAGACCRDGGLDPDAGAGAVLS